MKKKFFSLFLIGGFFLFSSTLHAQVRVKTNTKAKKVKVGKKHHVKHYPSASTKKVVVKPNKRRVVIKKPIRPKVVVKKPFKKRRGYIWIDGYWKWSVFYGQYIWVDARWERIRPGYRWVPGYWMEDPGGYFWIEGTWVL